MESGDLGEICGDCGGEPADVHEVLRARPDVVLVDFFMPVMEMCIRDRPVSRPDQGRSFSAVWFHDSRHSFFCPLIFMGKDHQLAEHVV